MRVYKFQFKKSYLAKIQKKRNNLNEKEFIKTLETKKQNKKKRKVIEFLAAYRTMTFSIPMFLLKLFLRHLKNSTTQTTLLLSAVPSYTNK